MIYTAKDIERICKSEVTYKVIRDQCGGFGEFWAEFHGNLIFHGNLRSIIGAPINERDDIEDYSVDKEDTLRDFRFAMFILTSTTAQELEFCFDVPENECAGDDCWDYREMIPKNIFIIDKKLDF